MSAPHRCPVCEGSGVFVQQGRAGRLANGDTPSRQSHPCHACNGGGVLWGPPGAATPAATPYPKLETFTVTCEPPEPWPFGVMWDAAGTVTCSMPFEIEAPHLTQHPIRRAERRP